MSDADRFSTHSEPAWRDRANFIINALIPREEGRFEQLWAKQVSEDRFEICCVPFFLFDVALGDVVQTHEAGGRKYVLSAVVEPSGRFVFRVWFGESFHPRDDIDRDLKGMGAVTEWSSPNLLAVDARDQTHAQEIADFLQEREDLGQLMYEAGKTS